MMYDVSKHYLMSEAQSDERDYCKVSEEQYNGHEHYVVHSEDK